MYRVSGSGPLYVVAERPVAVRALVDADARERIPLAEEDAVARVALGVGDVEAGDAGELAGQRDGHDERADAGESRRGSRPARRARAATSASAAAVRTTPGAPSRSSSGISTRQPAAAPVRSAA